MELKELRVKHSTELTKLLAQLREKLRDARFRVVAKQLKDVREIRALRKEIAQIHTILNTKKTLLKKRESAKQ